MIWKVLNPLEPKAPLFGLEIHKSANCGKLEWKQLIHRTIQSSTLLVHIQWNQNYLILSILIPTILKHI